MTNVGLNMNDIYKMTIGFDQIFKGLDNLNSFPPHNIIKLSDTEFVVELAVAGFSKEELSIEYEYDVLTITGDARKDVKEYLHKGIASRHFSKKLKLASLYKVSGANLKDGILSVFITRHVEESNRITIDLA